jgi:hypothetical protein
VGGPLLVRADDRSHLAGAAFLLGSYGLLMVGVGVLLAVEGIRGL